MTVIGIGNLYRGDDSAGLLAARRLHDLRPDLRVMEWKNDIVHVFEDLRGETTVILIDAVSSGAAPGTIHRFDADTQPLPARVFRSSTHAFGLADAVELERAMGGLPKTVILFGIEGASFDFGTNLSPGLDAAIDEVVMRVVEEVKSRA